MPFFSFSVKTEMREAPHLKRGHAADLADFLVPLMQLVMQGICDTEKVPNWSVINSTLGTGPGPLLVQAS